MLLHSCMCLLANVKCNELGIYFKMSVAYNNKDIQPHGHCCHYQVMSLTDHSLAVAFLGIILPQMLLITIYSIHGMIYGFQCHVKTMYLGSTLGQPNPSEIQPSPEDILGFATHATKLTPDLGPRLHLNESPWSWNHHCQTDKHQNLAPSIRNYLTYKSAWHKELPAWMFVTMKTCLAKPQDQVICPPRQ